MDLCVALMQSTAPELLDSRIGDEIDQCSNPEQVSEVDTVRYHNGCRSVHKVLN